VNRMQQAIAILKQKLQASAGIIVIYHRGSASTNVGCWLGNTAFRVNDQTNSRLVWSERDYLIPVENLKINGVLVTPTYGDWIEETDQNNVTRRFELSAPQGEQVWRYSDQQKTLYRIHTKERA
jgi:hypothetical protein